MAREVSQDQAPGRAIRRGRRPSRSNGPSTGSFGPSPPPRRDRRPSCSSWPQAYGVQTEYWDWQGQHVQVSPATIVAVLRGLDVDADAPTTPSSGAGRGPGAALAADAPGRRRDAAGARRQVPVHVTHGSSRAGVGRPRGRRRRAHPRAGRPLGRAARRSTARWWARRRSPLPGDLPLGWHRLHARSTTSATAARPTARWSSRPHGSNCRPRCGERPGVGVHDAAVLGALAPLLGRRATSPTWRSWRTGAAGRTAPDFVLVNPLHAAEPVPPMEPSPYLPTTRRFVNPIYLRVEDIREVADMPSTDRALVEWHGRAPMRGLNLSGRADRPRRRRGRAKSAALRAGVRAAALVGRARRGSRRSARREGAGPGRLRHLVRAGRALRLPTGRLARRRCSDPRSAGGRGSSGSETPTRVEFHRGCSGCSTSSSPPPSARPPARAWRSGIMHDLAVGVHPEGADAWALQDVFAPRHHASARRRTRSTSTARTGRSRRGGRTGWPSSATRRSATWCAPCCGTPAGCGSTTSSGCSGCGGSRAGTAPTEGTYVRYDHEALIGILALEAQRAGRRRGRRGPGHGRAVGARLPARTRHARHVDPVVRVRVRRRGGRCARAVAGVCLASVTTHDLPPTAGYLAGDHVRAARPARPADPVGRGGAGRRGGGREQRGSTQLRERGPARRTTPSRARARSRRCTATWRWTPARLLGVALTDAVGDRRTHEPAGDRTTSTPTGGCRCRTASAGRYCSRT